MPRRALVSVAVRIAQCCDISVQEDIAGGCVVLLLFAKVTVFVSRLVCKEYVAGGELHIKFVSVAIST